MDSDSNGAANKDLSPPLFWTDAPTKNQNTRRCLLCLEKTRSHFYCKGCLNRGLFSHSVAHIKEHFAEKQYKHINLRAALKSLDHQALALFRRKCQLEQLRSTIRNKQRNIEVLQRLIRERRRQAGLESSQQGQLQEFNADLRFKLPKYEDKVKKLEDYVLQKLEDVAQRRQTADTMNSDLCKVVCWNVNKMIRFIFPIRHVLTDTTTPTKSTQSTIMDTSSAIAEAARTTYVKGKWVLHSSTNSGDSYVIVAPHLPGDGDYSVYNEWTMTAGSGGIPATTNSDLSSHRNPAYRISAALTFTAQLVSLLSFYLDVRLPCKIVSSDFCKCDLAEQTFSRKVARLNASILFLCYSQNMKIFDLHPTHTLANLDKLLTPARHNLGRRGCVDAAMCLPDSINTQLAKDLALDDDSETDDDGNLATDWESVGGKDLEGSPALVSHPHQLTQQQSLMTSAATSLASIWRWTTGK